MSRINTNISSLQAITTLNKNQNELATHLQRLSSGLKINAGKDAPAGLIASESLRSEIAGINQAVDNSQRAGNVINTAEGALSEVSSLLLEVQTLTNQAANTGALSPDEIKANQLQVDSILTSINRVSNGRAVLGIGRGDSALAHLGRAPARLAQFERYLRQLQTYLRGEAVSFEEIDIPFDAAPPMSALELHDAPPASRIA